MGVKLEQRIVDILESVVDSKIENYDVKNHIGNEKGEGYFGEVRFLSLTNKKSGKNYHMVIKVVHPSEKKDSREVMSSMYFNEIQYYTKIFPALLDFQKLYPNVKIFDNFPKCYATSLDTGFEKLAIENLKFQNYEIHQKTLPMDLKTFEEVFKMYGNFHALAFAFKYYQPEEFSELTKNLNNNWIKAIIRPKIFNKYSSYFFKKIKEYLEEECEDISIIKKFEKYHKNPQMLLEESVTYKGSNGTILHGDCWSNNMLFKYNPSREIEHIKMIDFQMGLVGSPVNDLSYNFYAGSAENATLNNLEYLLKIYHNTLSDTLKKYGCNPDEIYSYEVLKKEWKEYSQFGYIMGTILWVHKLATDLSEMPTVNEMIDETVEMSESNSFGIKYDEATYKKIALKLVKHMHENNFL